MKKETSGALLIVLEGLSFSFMGVLSKYCSWNAFSIAGFRSLIAAVLLGVIRGSFKLDKRPVNWIGALGVAATAVLFIVSNKLTSAANAVVLQYAMPIVVLVYQVVVLKQKPTRREMTAVCTVVLGVALCFCQGFSSGGMLGNALALLASLTWSIVYLAAQQPGSDALTYSYQGNLLSSLLLLAMPFDPAVRLGDPTPWLAAAGLGLCLGVGYLFFSLGMRKGLPPMKAAIISNVEPVLNPVWCFLILGENPGPLSLVGAAIVLAAVTVFSVQNAKPRT